ncbi:GAF and ANTAR domain-containing protein [Pseudarthrobacter sp. J75]|uniref:GAF and ANTAR domain-containing protein n=1 Tax=unclassified Pseudarthrobacter TaxID=2647000 RepID=UPI002E80CCB1|nr:MULTISPECIES: GAF and ANTAR domain-containing protein [unclassified Pseudarthrobacter]MEE2523461.1 GAF and ANTAR domain-containing protein [Pseudarthrobacter sp. J47]MEE2530436.1 GAF and ANTAR domain-containing protein [Pseudarthrobacter sp. J75]MEE2570148.1 GAF and ANTAR domain-containing protein [Pseudarthrobacter sp. J64]
MASLEPELSPVDRIQNLILESADFEDFLNELAELSAKATSADGNEVLCGITLLRDRQAATIGWSSEKAREVDEIQYSLAQGPCLTSAMEQKEVYVPDLLEEDRWGPDYALAVAKHGLRSVLSLPFDLQGEAKAALNLYSVAPNAFGDAARKRAWEYTREVSQALRLAVRFALHNDNAVNLRASMKSRTAIDLALGILMAQNRCSQDEAFKILSQAASNSNTKLRVLAENLVSRVGGAQPATHFEEPTHSHAG